MKQSINTSSAVLALCTHYNNGVKASTPLESYEQIKWAFETLQNAPFRFTNVSKITIKDHDISFDMKTTSVKKLIKKLNKLKYTYYRIDMDCGSYVETYTGGGERSTKRDNIPQDVIDLLHLFTKD